MFQEWLGRHPAFTAAALRQFCGRLREAGCGGQAGGGSAAARIADKLLRIAAHDGSDVLLTRREIGEMTGLTVETSIRVTKDFERAGWVALSRGRLRILDAASLESCAHGEVVVPRNASLRLVNISRRKA
jgi:CRP/FNR family transcriptional regulator